MRDALTVAAVERAAAITALGNDYRPAGEILDERAFVNGMVGLMATGGSTNLVLHLPAMARAAGVILDLEDFADISDAVPLMAKVYPNGLADVNHFHAAGGLGFMIGAVARRGAAAPRRQEPWRATGWRATAQEPKLVDGALVWRRRRGRNAERQDPAPGRRPFQTSGGLKQLTGNLGRGVIKVSAVAPERHVIEAPARIFHDQNDVKAAFQRGRVHQRHASSSSAFRGRAPTGCRNCTR